MTTIAPGESWQTAYKEAAPGEVLTVGPGLHPAVQLDRVAGRTGDPVIFEFAPGAEAQSITSGRSGGSVVTPTGAERWGLSKAKVRGEIAVRWGSDLVLFEDVDAGNIRITSCRNVSVRRFDFGPWIDQVATINSAGGGAPGVFDILFEDGVLHDYVVSDPAKHAEGMQIWPSAPSERVTLRRARFVNCTDFDVLVKAPSLKDLLIEESEFDVPIPGNVATRNCLPVTALPGQLIADCGPRWGSAIRLSTHAYPGARILNNIVKKPATITVDNKAGVTETGTVFVDTLPPVGEPPPDPPPDPPPADPTVDELIDKAATAFRATTVTYATWKKNVDAGAYVDVKTTKWWQGFDWLEKAKAL
jgi:hypothetical protein